MNDEVEAVGYIAALEGRKTAAEWTMVSLGMLSLVWWIFLIAYWAMNRG